MISKEVKHRGNLEEEIVLIERKIANKGDRDLSTLKLIWRPFQFNEKTLSEIDHINSLRKYKHPLVFLILRSDSKSH